MSWVRISQCAQLSFNTEVSPSVFHKGTENRIHALKDELMNVLGVLILVARSETFSK